MNKKNIVKILNKIGSIILLVFVIKNQVDLVTSRQPIERKQDSIVIQPQEKKQDLVDIVFDFSGTYPVSFSGGSTRTVIILPTILSV